MNPISLRINELIEKLFEGNNSKFANKIGINEANVRNYRKGTQFKIDVLTLLPIDIFALAWPHGRERLFALVMFRLSKILRFGQMFELVRALAPLENKILRAFSRVGIGISEGGVRFLKMLQMFILVAHWIGCLWFVVGFQSSLRLASGFAANL